MCTKGPLMNTAGLDVDFAFWGYDAIITGAVLKGIDPVTIQNLSKYNYAPKSTHLVHL